MIGRRTSSDVIAQSRAGLETRMLLGCVLHSPPDYGWVLQAAYTDVGNIFKYVLLLEVWMHWGDYTPHRILQR